MIPDRWLRIRVDLPEGPGRGLAADLMIRHGAASVAEDVRGLVTYLPPPRDHETVVDGLAGAIEAELDGPVEVSWSWQPHEQWSELWKQGLEARRIGERLLVAPSWIELGSTQGREVLRIDPGLAFGTAEHATTRGCLEHLDAVVRGGETVLDVGTGSGILAIAAVRLGAASAVGVEADAMACAAAADNVRLNDVEGFVTIVCRELPPGADFRLGRFGLVVANMVMELLSPRLEAMKSALAPDGVLILGGVEEGQRGRFRSTLVEAALHPLAERTDDGWWSVRARRA